MALASPLLIRAPARYCSDDQVASDGVVDQVGSPSQAVQQRMDRLLSLYVVGTRHVVVAGREGGAADGME